MERRVLGKGLSALIPDREEREAAPVEQVNQGQGVVYLDIEKIKASRLQPREDFNPEKLKELAVSIKEKGVIQPILVRAMGEGYELIAGERRFRAAKSLNLRQLPAIIKDVTDSEALELSLIENVQREDLNAIDQALAYSRLVKEFGFSHEKISQAIGKDRSSVTNIMRLLQLPSSIQDLIRQKKVSMGQARAVLPIETEAEQMLLCQEIMARNLSVREVEHIVNTKVLRKRRVRKNTEERDRHIVAIEEELQHLFTTKVKITEGKKRGNIQIEYYSRSDLERILEILRK